VKVHSEEELITMLEECGRNCWELVHIEHTTETPKMGPVKEQLQEKLGFTPKSAETWLLVFKQSIEG